MSFKYELSLFAELARMEESAAADQKGRKASASAVDAAAAKEVPSTPETTQGQADGFFSQFSFTCYLPEVTSVED